MIVVNFSHPLTSEQIEQIERLADAKMARILPVKTQFDQELAFIPQVTALADAAGLSPEEWQTEPLVIILPALNFIAAGLLAELHGRMGYFPTCVRLRPVAGSAPPQFEVAELLPLNEVREKARQRR